MSTQERQGTQSPQSPDSPQEEIYTWTGRARRWLLKRLPPQKLLPQDQPGFWEQNGYNMYGDPWKEERYW